MLKDDFEGVIEKIIILKYEQKADVEKQTEDENCLSFGPCCNLTHSDSRIIGD